MSLLGAEGAGVLGLQRSVGNRATARLLAAGPAGDRLPAGLRTYLSRSRGGGSPLQRDARERLEHSFGRELGQVRVHAGPEAAWAARSVRARAFAFGNDIWFGAGEYRPDDPAGRHVLAHEVAHTLEQPAAAPLDHVRIAPANHPAETRADHAAQAVCAHARGRVLPEPRRQRHRRD